MPEFPWVLLGKRVATWLQFLSLVANCQEKGEWLAIPKSLKKKNNHGQWPQDGEITPPPTNIIQVRQDMLKKMVLLWVATCLQFLSLVDNCQEKCEWLTIPKSLKKKNNHGQWPQDGEIISPPTNIIQVKQDMSKKMVLLQVSKKTFLGRSNYDFPGELKLFLISILSLWLSPLSLSYLCGSCLCLYPISISEFWYHSTRDFLWCSLEAFKDFFFFFFLNISNSGGNMCTKPKTFI